MKVNRISEVKPYEAKKHFDMKGLRLQGFEASPRSEEHTSELQSQR